MQHRKQRDTNAAWLFCAEARTECGRTNILTRARARPRGVGEAFLLPARSEQYPSSVHGWVGGWPACWLVTYAWAGKIYEVGSAFLSRGAG